jgi:hypothetical protein
MSEQSASAGMSFFLCKSVNNVEDVKTVVRLLYTSGLLPADGTHPNFNVVLERDIDTFIEGRRLDLTAFKAGGLFNYPFPVVVEGREALYCIFNCGFLEKGVTLSVGGSVNKRWIEGADPIEYIEPFAQRLVKVGKRLYKAVEPAYGYVDDTDVEYPGSHFQRAIKRQLITLNWVTFFGPEYVEAYGRDFLMHIPGWKTEGLPDGGIFCQARPSFMVRDKVAHQEWQQQVKGYFTAANVEISFGFPPF